MEARPPSTWLVGNGPDEQFPIDEVAQFRREIEEAESSSLVSLAECVDIVFLRLIGTWVLTSASASFDEGL